MKRRIDSLLREKINLDSPPLKVSVSSIDLILEKGKQYTGTFRIGASDGKKIRGAVYSDHQRIVTDKDEFKGNSCLISYGVDTYALEDGSVIEGNITILSSAGEIKIPLKAEITDTVKKPFGSIETFEDFIKLASSDYRKAFLIFTDENFHRLLKDGDRRHLTVYRAFSQNPVTYQHLEEFLIAAGKKEPVTIRTDKQPRTEFLLKSSVKDTIYINRNTWGYTRIEVITQGDFIEVEKNQITTDDFIGKSFGLEFILNRRQLGNRRKRGKIILKTVYQEITLEIEAVPEDEMEPLGTDNFCKKRKLLIFRNYLMLKLKKTDYRSWYETTKQLIDEIKIETEDFFTLFSEAYLALCQEDNKRLAEILWPVKSGEIKLTEYWQKAVYLYLAKEAGILPEEERDITSRLYAFYQQEPANYLILELYLNELEKKNYITLSGMDELEAAYRCGCRSPFLYLRAWKVMEKQESILRKLDPFTIKVLLFAHKQGVLTKSVLLRCAFLGANLKSFNGTYYRILTEGYEKYPEKDLLEAICRHIMKDRPASPEFYKWYSRAVEQDIRIARLYEYYMETRPDDSDEPIPLSVRLYFSNTHTLSERKKAVLYAYVVKNRREDPATYNHYDAAILDFAIKSLQKRRINEYYAILYSEYFNDVNDAETAGYLWDILFTRRLTCTDKKMRSVIVSYPVLKETYSYPISDMVAFPVITGKNACILLEDDKKRRYLATAEYNLEKLFESDELAQKCYDCGIWDTKMHMYMCERQHWDIRLEKNNLLKYWRAAENASFLREYRDKVRRCILNYLDSNCDDWEFVSVVDSIKELTYGCIDKDKTADLLISFGKYDKAYSLISRHGYEGVDLTNLIKLAAEKISSSDYEKDEELLQLALHIFRCGRFNDSVLEYLCKWYEGSLEDMEALWGRCINFNIDTFDLEERYLLCSMFVMRTSSLSEDIFENYSKKSGKMIVRKAYLTFLAILYIIKNRKIKSETAERMRLAYEKEPGFGLFCAAAWLKYKAESGSFDEKDLETAGKILSDIIGKGMRFAFFKLLPQKLQQRFSLEDKVYAEENFPSGSAVTINYCLETDEGVQVQTKEPIKECPDALFVREFLLFYGEKIRYNCTVSFGDKTSETGEKCLKITERDISGDSKYKLLNKMLMQKSMREEKDVDATMHQYIQKEKYANRLFKPV